MNRGIGRRGLLAAAGGLLAAPAVVRAQGQAGVALVIGNSKYQWEASLPNVRRDAPDIARCYQALGLKTELLQDVGRDAMHAAIDKLKAAASGANLVAFYFAGHGVSWEKDSYVVPVDADLSNPSAVKTLVPVPEISVAAKGAAHRLLVFDSCRNNPADGWRQLAAERASGFNLDKQRADTADAAPNSLTLYSTAPGRTALDGPAGENSPFAAALLRQLATSSADVQALPGRIRRELLMVTEGRQVVWDRNTYTAPFVLAGGARPGGAPPSGGDPSRNIELPNAYAFASKNGLPLPEGLIARRPAAGSAHAQKVGSFQFVANSLVGPHPFLIIVLSVDEQGTAQLVEAVQNEAGRLWRFITGSVTGNRLTFQPNYGRPNFLLDWSDANSGSVGMLASDNPKTGGGGIGGSIRSVRFTRLDG